MRSGSAGLLLSVRVEARRAEHVPGQQAVAARVPRRRLVRGLGETFEIMNASIKRWSVGSPIQAPLDSLLALMKENAVKADDVVRVVVRVAHQGANTVDNRDMPDICMQRMCAVMLIDGTVSFASSHDEKRMRDRRVLSIRQKIELLGDDCLLWASDFPHEATRTDLHKLVQEFFDRKDLPATAKKKIARANPTHFYAL